MLCGVTILISCNIHSTFIFLIQFQNNTILYISGKMYNLGVFYRVGCKYENKFSVLIFSSEYLLCFQNFIVYRFDKILYCHILKNFWKFFSHFKNDRK